MLRANDSAPLPVAPEATVDSAAVLPETEDYGDPTARVGALLSGKYQLVEAIGAGGMGSVFLAQQTEPVKRAVAVKFIKAGMDSRAVLVRFEAERQALAMMDHPNIAKVLDAGTTDGGRPFFVMELVKGAPLTRYCDDHKLTPRRRLKLFVPVCQAIQHAHQKGIIHRDIKPSNVLVTLYDDRPVPKVIDFGVAKAAGQTLTDKTEMTGFGAIVGTPEYMSPEQAGLNNLDIDTRSDVYSLGVLLYELLTGTTPVDKKNLGDAALLEILRIVREVEAPRPSAKLRTIDALPTVAADRGSEPAKLSRLMKGELDWLVMKALEKDRTRRYETANGLARDIQRYLADEVVEARPPSVGYRVSKFVRRHKGQVIAASLVLVALVAGVIGTTLGMVQAYQAAEAERIAKYDAVTQKWLAEEAAEQEAQTKKREIQRADGERQAKLEAKAKRQEAERNLAFAKKGNAILGSVFAGLDPMQIAESGRPLQDVLRQNLSKAVQELDGSAVGEPLEVAAMQNTLGGSLLGLGEASLAAVVFQKALATLKAKLGPDHPNTLATMNNLAVAYKDSGQLAKAVALLEETLEKKKARLGPDHPDTLGTMNNLAAAYLGNRQPAKAAPLLEETLEKRKARLGPDHPDTLASKHNLAAAYLANGQLAKAVPLFEEALDKMKAKLGPDHPATLRTMYSLAKAYHSSGQLAKVVPLLEETLAKRKAKLGPGHPSTLTTMGSLAVAYLDRGQLTKAVPLLEETLQKMKVKLGPGHPDTLLAKKNLDFARSLLTAEGRYRAKLVELGPRHIDTLLARRDMAQTYMSTNRLDYAEEVLLEVLQGIDDRAPDDAIVVFTTGLLRRCLTQRQQATPQAWQTFNTQSLLGGVLLAQKRYAEAEPLLLKGYKGLKTREATIPNQGGAESRIPDALDRLIELYTVTNKPAEANEWRAERAKYPE